MDDSQNIYKITTKGQVALLKKLRDQLKIKPGDYVSIYLVEDKIVLSKKRPSESLLTKEEISQLRESLSEKRVGKKPNKKLKEIYDQATLLEESDRILLIKSLLKSIAKTVKLNPDLDFLSLRGIGNGLWGSKEEIESHIGKERSSWDD